MSPLSLQDISAYIFQTIQLLVEVLVLLVQISYALFLSIKNLIVRKKLKPVKSETVVITGAGHGIGKELAILYASEGATVVVWDINEKNAIQTVKDIAELGYPRAYFFVCDVSKRDSVQRVAKRVVDQVGKVTVLINNAGVVFPRPFLNQTKEEIEKTMNTNVMAHFWTLEAFLPSMKEYNYGHIVAISSCSGLNGIPNLVPYTCSKYAVRGLMESLYKEFKQDKKNEIKFTTVYLYFVDTGFVKKPKIRFQNVMKMLEPKEAAKEIMNAQRGELREISIPRYFLPVLLLLGLLPMKARRCCTEFLAAGVEPEF